MHNCYDTSCQCKMFRNTECLQIGTCKIPPFMLNCSYSSAMPIHKLPDGTDWLKYTCFPAAYFMSGVRPIEMIV